MAMVKIMYFIRSNENNIILTIHNMSIHNIHNILTNKRKITI